MSNSAGSKTSSVERYVHHSGEELEIPVGRVVGAHAGPRFGVSAAMHAGEPAGVRAAIRLWRDLDPARLSGEVLIIPIMSTRAFFARSMQLSPVDQREMHYQPVGNPGGSYSEFQIDCVFNLLRDLDFHVDMHAGEYVQSLHPWVAFMEPQDPRQRRDAWRLAGSFPVPHLDPRTPQDMPIGLPIALLDAGVVNVWTEIGQNGLQEADAIEMQYRGLTNALHRFGMLDGPSDAVPAQEVVGPRRWTLETEHTGYWRPIVRPGQQVRKGERLGEIRSLDGRPLDVVTAPDDALVQYVWTSPAINADRTPHGYTWHRGLVRLVEIRPAAAEDERLDMAR